jgi:hypothetical protein
MDLAKSHQRGGCIPADCLGQQPAILKHSFSFVGGRKPKIQFAGSILCAVGMAQAAAAGTESVPEPVVLLPARLCPFGYRKPLDAVRGDAGNGRGWHQFLARRPLETHA